MSKMKKDEEKRRKITWITFAILAIIYLIFVIFEMEALSPKTNEYRHINTDSYLLVIINIIFIIFCLFSMIYIKIKYEKSLKVVQEYEYYRDIDFKKVNATISGILLNTEKININTIITAIFELSEKKIIKIKLKEGKNHITLREHNKEKIARLLPYEKKIIYFIFESNEDIKEYCLENILAEAKRDATKTYILKDIEQEIKKYANKKCYETFGNYITEPTIPLICTICSMLCTIIFILGILPCIMGLANQIETKITILIVEYIVNLGLFIYLCKGKFLKQEYLEEVQKLAGLYKYMSDYTLLHEQELKFYQLYNTYYLYAMGLGLADKFENELGQGALNNDVRTALQFYIQNREEIQ